MARSSISWTACDKVSGEIAVKGVGSRLCGKCDASMVNDHGASCVIGREALEYQLIWRDISPNACRFYEGHEAPRISSFISACVVSCIVSCIVSVTPRFSHGSIFGCVGFASDCAFDAAPEPVAARSTRLVAASTRARHGDAVWLSALGGTSAFESKC